MEIGFFTIFTIKLLLSLRDNRDNESYNQVQSKSFCLRYVYFVALPRGSILSTVYEHYSKRTKLSMHPRFKALLVKLAYGKVVVWFNCQAHRSVWSTVYEHS